MTPESRYRDRRSAHAGEEGEKREKREEAAASPTEPPEMGPEETAESDLERLEEMEIPEASFLELVQPLEIQALQFLGEVPMTRGGERRTMPKWAKHVIDLLGILEDRTRGNLADDEKKYLETVLHELRMRYLKVKS